MLALVRDVQVSSGGAVGLPLAAWRRRRQLRAGGTSLQVALRVRCHVRSANALLSSVCLPFICRFCSTMQPISITLEAPPSGLQTFDLTFSPASPVPAASYPAVEKDAEKHLPLPHSRHWRSDTLVCSVASEPAAKALAGKTFTLGGFLYRVNHDEGSRLRHPGCVPLFAHAPRFTADGLKEVLQSALVPDIVHTVQGVRDLSYSRASSAAKIVYVIPNSTDLSIGGIPPEGRMVRVWVPGEDGGTFTIKLSRDSHKPLPNSVLGKHRRDPTPAASAPSTHLSPSSAARPVSPTDEEGMSHDEALALKLKKQAVLT